MAKKLSQTKSSRIEKNRDKVKSKNSQKWADYRKKKKRIMSYKSVPIEEKKARLEKERAIVRNNIKFNWENYRSYKYGIIYESPYKGLRYDKKKRTRFTRQEYFTVKRGTDLDKTTGKIFDDPKVRYVLVILEIELIEGTIVHVSDSFTKDAYEQVIGDDEFGEETGELLIEKVLEKMSFVQKYEGYKLKSTHIRVIYENTKKSKQ